MSGETIRQGSDPPSPGVDRSYAPLRTVLISLPLALLAGLIAGLCAALVMVLLRLWAGIPTPMELFGDYYLQHINVNTFMSLLLTLKGNAKTEPLGLALLSMLAI